MPKKFASKQDGVAWALDLRDIDPSPYQHRKIFDSDKLKELALSIQRDGLISPILVKESTRMVFINADWLDFQGIPARDEHPANSIMIDDYIRCDGTAFH